MASFLDAIFGVGPSGVAAQRQLNAQTALNAANAISTAAQGVGGDPFAARRDAQRMFEQQQAQTDAATQGLRFQEDEAQKNRMKTGFASVLDGISDATAFGLSRNGAQPTQAQPAQAQATQAQATQAAIAPTRPPVEGIPASISNPVEGIPASISNPVEGIPASISNPVEGVPPMLARPPAPAATQQNENSSTELFRNILQNGVQIASLFSDERAKDNIRPTSDQEMRSFLDSYQGREFDMKPELGGQHMVGTTAQELERTPVGRTMVTTTPSGLKAIDKNAAISTLLAATRSLHDRVNDLESTRSKPQGGSESNESVSAEARRREAERADWIAETRAAQAREARHARSMRSEDARERRAAEDVDESLRTRTSDPNHPVSAEKLDRLLRLIDEVTLTSPNMEAAERAQSSRWDRPLTPDEENAVRSGTEAANRYREATDREAEVQRLMEQLRRNRNR